VLNPLGIRRLGEFSDLTGAMRHAGWNRGKVAKVMGENWLRALREVWGD
jgi:membrane dipeptidase